ncbi:MAG: hypothetical protein WKF92_02990 [Pyrinomonadaceae bacterium]
MTAISVENTLIRSRIQEHSVPGVTYPSYKSFDEFIDVERLKSLDGYLRRRIARHILSETQDFFVNAHCLETDAPYKPGVKEIWLTRTVPGTPYDYLDLNRIEIWQPTEKALEFTTLMAFIETLPFESTGRVLIIYDDEGRSVPAHRDHERTDVCHDFIWFRTNLIKPFYVLNEVANEKLYVDSHSAWFDTVNQYHGSDAAEGLSFSIRVDGHFTEEFRRQIPQPAQNLASTPALWREMEI